MILYHASKEVVEYPEIRKTKFTKDFIVQINMSKRLDGQIVVREHRLSTYTNMSLIKI